MIVAIMIVLFFVVVACGAPVFTALAGSGIIANLLGVGVKATFVPLSMFSANDSWPVLAAPFFLLSGNLMGKCGPAEALFDLCDNYLGHIRGGICYAVIAACTLFGAVTGSAIATALAIGGIALPEMLKKGYSAKLSFGLIAMSGTLGLMIPPSIYMVLFAGIANGDILEYFTAGWLPGLTMAATLCLVAHRLAPNIVGEKHSKQDRRSSLLRALPALGMPLVIMGSIYSGIFTPTESAALSILYCIIICPLFYRGKFSKKTFYEACKSTLSASGQIYIILGAVQIFSTVLNYMQVPQQISTLAASLNVSSTVMLLIIIAIYFVFGMIIDAIPIMYMTVPIFLPVVQAYGINVTHFMIITVFMMMIAQVTPPFGVILFALSGTFNQKVEVIVQGVIPFLIATLCVVIVIILFPQISLFLPGLTMG